MPGDDDDDDLAEYGIHPTDEGDDRSVGDHPDTLPEEQDHRASVATTLADVNDQDQEPGQPDITPINIFSDILRTIKEHIAEDPNYEAIQVNNNLSNLMCNGQLFGRVSYGTKGFCAQIANPQDHLELIKKICESTPKIKFVVKLRGNVDDCVKSAKAMFENGQGDNFIFAYKNDSNPAAIDEFKQKLEAACPGIKIQPPYRHHHPR